MQKWGIDMSVNEQLKKLMKAEDDAWGNLMRDDWVEKNPGSGHNPVLWKVYIDAADAERNFREQHFPD